MTVDPKEATRALNGWARSQGYADFDTYMASGGSIREAMLDLQKRRQKIDLATAAIYQWQAPPPPPEPEPPQPERHREEEDFERAAARINIGDDALRAAEAEVTGEPVEDNAQVQGFEV